MKKAHRFIEYQIPLVVTQQDQTISCTLCGPDIPHICCRPIPVNQSQADCPKAGCYQTGTCLMANLLFAISNCQSFNVCSLQTELPIFFITLILEGQVSNFTTHDIRGNMILFTNSSCKNLQPCVGIRTCWQLPGRCPFQLNIKYMY